MNFCALDLSSFCGYALDLDDVDASDNPEYGSVKFDGPIGMRAFVFEQWLERIIKDRRVTTIAIEGAVPVTRTTSLDAILWLRGTELIVRKVCAARKINLMVVNLSTWRSFFINIQPPKGLSKYARRKWLKAMTIAQCHEMGLDPQDDNAADALGLLTYCLACFDPKNGMDPNELYAEAA